jgi:hypothetical protein
MVVNGDTNGDPVFQISPNITGVSLSGLAIQGGMPGAIWNQGGSTLTISDSAIQGFAGIYNESAGTVTITNSSIDNSRHGIYNLGTATVINSTMTGDQVLSPNTGGAIYNTGVLSIVSSTITGNTAISVSAGGGIENNGGSVTITSSTITDNIVGVEGAAGINNDGGTMSVAGTVLAQNYTAGVHADCGGGITDAGYNIADDATCGFSTVRHPYLGPLQDNGGPTQTQEPALGSRLLDVIPLGATGNGITLCPSTDQRGVSRPQGSACDVGAVELSPTPQNITSSDRGKATAGQPFSFTVTTIGTPTPKITETPVPFKGFHFVDNGNGTATMSGKTTKVGSHLLLITATFGSGTSAQYVVLQAFRLTVT